MRVLSVQSSVSYGHVGNAAAVFPLQRLGHEVWAVPTVVLANHTGYPTSPGLRPTAAQVSDLLGGLEERGALDACDAVLSGYLGTADLAAVVAGTVDRVRAGRPGATYLCDPVLGDADRGFFVAPETAETVRRELVPRADVVTPNLFELGVLTGTAPETLEDVVGAARALTRQGPGVVLVTSVLTATTPAGGVEMLAVSPEGAWLVATPLLPMPAHGAGDLTAALFLAHLGEGVPRALARTASSVHGVLRRTLDAGESELMIVAAQQWLADPPCEFEVTAL